MPSKYPETGTGAPMARGTDGPSNQYIPKDEHAPSDTGAAQIYEQPLGLGTNLLQIYGWMEG